eukprot:3167467-Rhodomonas_salina.2
MAFHGLFPLSAPTQYTALSTSTAVHRSPYHTLGTIWSFPVQRSEYNTLKPFDFFCKHGYHATRTGGPVLNVSCYAHSIAHHQHSTPPVLRSVQYYAYIIVPQRHETTGRNIPGSA